MSIVVNRQTSTGILVLSHHKTMWDSNQYAISGSKCYCSLEHIKNKENVFLFFSVFLPPFFYFIIFFVIAFIFIIYPNLLPASWKISTPHLNKLIPKVNKYRRKHNVFSYKNHGGKNNTRVRGNEEKDTTLFLSLEESIVYFHLKITEKKNNTRARGNEEKSTIFSLSLLFHFFSLLQAL